jgi:protein TonB
MTRTDYRWMSPNAHLLVGEMPAPRQMGGRWWEGTSLSIAAHAIVFGLLLYAATHVKQVVQTIDAVSGPLVFIDHRGPGGGGSDGADTADPPRPVQSIATKASQLMPVTNPADTPPPPDVKIPVVTAQAVETLPGSMTDIDGTSPGRGSSRGGDGGRGPGSGPGDGPGLGPGSLGGFGGDAFNPGNGVTSPQLIKEVRPNYTGDAMRARIQGIVEMQAVVLPDGSVDPSRIRITRSLDASLGLDQQALLAVKQWRFKPGTREGHPVSVWVNVELTFTLR